MPLFERSSEMPAPADELFAWHSRAGAFTRLVPPWQDIRLLEDPGAITEGSELLMEIRTGLFKVRWRALHRDFVPGRAFVDVQLKGPFASWKHSHLFEPAEGGKSMLHDRLEYKLPLHPLSQAAAGWYARKNFERMFRFRHLRTKNDLLRHQQFADRPRLKVAISGASGVVGTALRAFLFTGGHKVFTLVRRKANSEFEIEWNPARGEIDAAALEGLDAVINLSGENLTSGRWTHAKREAIIDSRVRSATLLAKTMRALKRPPATLLSASAVGFYGDRPPEQACEEDQGPGQGFLSEVCDQWETAADQAECDETRVVHLRIGVALSHSGGALGQMILPFSLGLGGPAGTGEQYISWVHLDDVVYAIHHALFTRGLDGPVNLVSPNPVTNAEFSRTLARVLHRPNILRLPAWLIESVYGEMGKTLLLEGARAVPSALVESGYEFAWPNLEDALRFEVGRL